MLEFKAPSVLSVRWDLLELLELQDPPEHQVFKVLKVHKELMVLQEPPVLRDLLALLEHKESQDQLGPLAELDQLGPWAEPAPQDLQDFQGKRACRARSDQPEFVESLDLRVLRE